MLDVHIKFARHADSEWTMRASLDVIARLFVLAPEAVRRIETAAADGEFTELFGNGRTHGAWGLLAKRDPVFSIVVFPQG